MRSRESSMRRWCGWCVTWTPTWSSATWSRASWSWIRFLVRRSYSRRFWLLARYRTGGTEVLRITLTSGEEALPVFSFEDEAKMFLKLGTSCGGWRVRVTTVGELVSVLFGPCAGVGWIVLDPLPPPFAESLMDPAGMGRDAFMESHLGVQRPPVVRVRAWHGAPPRPPKGANGGAHEEANVNVEQINRCR